MNAKDFQDWALAHWGGQLPSLIKPAESISREELRSLVIMSIGLPAEAGEAADCLKKHVRGDQSLSNSSNLNKLKLELGDVLHYLTVICGCCGFTLEEVMQANFDKLAERARLKVAKEVSSDPKD